MTKEKILRKAIEKAVENGWKRNYDWVHSTLSDEWYPWEITHTIFSHDFAKAFWKEGIKYDWQYHLQQMVILTDNEKLKYLEKYL